MASSSKPKQRSSAARTAKAAPLEPAEGVVDGAPGPDEQVAGDGASGAGPAEDVLAQIGPIVEPAFDPRFYGEEYPDVAGDDAARLRHYLSTGWMEGRNPSAGFDTLEYLLRNPDVAAAGVEPLAHYLSNGKAEGRAAWPAVRPSAAGFTGGDWVAAVRPFVDPAFYAAQLGFQAAPPFDVAAHFAFRGWVENWDPSPVFSVRRALAADPSLLSRRLNPVLAGRMAVTAARERTGGATSGLVTGVTGEPGAGLRTTRFPAGWDAVTDDAVLVGRVVAWHQQFEGPPTSGALDPVAAVIAPWFDRGYYRAMNPDVIASGYDLLQHFVLYGAAEGRNPAPWFDIGFYRRSNPDVAATEVNPFWHYLVAGRDEGREPADRGSVRRRIVEAAKTPEQRTRDWSRPEPVAPLSVRALRAVLRGACLEAAGLVVSVGHDVYSQVTGGTQLVIAEEQEKFTRRGYVYLNVSPYHPGLSWARAETRAAYVNLVIDGWVCGIATCGVLAEVLADMPAPIAPRRVFIVHCLLGHHLESMAAVQAASGAEQNLFWLHDFSSACEGYTLLRNDAAFCHAPPVDSLSCRVCVYGARRPAHVSAIRALFARIPFTVVSPSQSALDIWLGAGLALPHAGVRVEPHCTLEPLAAEDEAAGATALVRRGLGSPAEPVVVAFLGYPAAHKGWPLWLELVKRSARSGAYRFIHFCQERSADTLGAIEYQPATASPGDRDGMIRALRDQGVDLVCVLSTWPETFSFVTFEALASGADVVCLADSGNVAATVLALGRGLVAEGEEALYELFESLRAVDYVVRCQAAPAPLARLVYDGTSLDVIDHG